MRIDDIFLTCFFSLPLSAKVLSYARKRREHTKFTPKQFDRCPEKLEFSDETIPLGESPKSHNTSTAASPVM